MLEHLYIYEENYDVVLHTHVYGLMLSRDIENHFTSPPYIHTSLHLLTPPSTSVDKMPKYIHIICNSWNLIWIYI